jgi:hypothetical protein
MQNGRRHWRYLIFSGPHPPNQNCSNPSWTVLTSPPSTRAGDLQRITALRTVLYYLVLSFLMLWNSIHEQFFAQPIFELPTVSHPKQVLMKTSRELGKEQKVTRMLKNALERMAFTREPCHGLSQPLLRFRTSR